MQSPKILIIEDEDDIRELIRYNLERERFQVVATGSGEKGLALARAFQPDLILLDLVLPGLQGLEVCRQLRQRPESRSIPVVMLTAKNEESDIVVGLELGADDYVSKPFGVKELVARVRAVLRRYSSSGTGESREIRVGSLVINPARHEVLLSGRKLDLTLAEFRLLRALAAHPGIVFTRDQLLNEITDGKTVIIDRNIDVHVRGVRKKLGPDRHLISTIRGVGYRFEEVLKS